MKAQLPILFAVTIALASAAAADTIVVDWDGGGDYLTIQAGIDAASAGDTVLVECGTYYEHDIEMKSGVCLQSETGEAECVTIDAQGQGGVMWASHLDEATEVRGFTITGANTVQGSFGSGLFCQICSSLSLTNLVFLGNATWMEGGGIRATSSSLSLTNVVFRGNSASGNGGGAHLSYGSEASLVNVAFIDNSAGGFGGGLYLEGGPWGTWEGVRFEGNYATYGGGALYLGTAMAAITDAVFTDNTTAGQGGAVVVLFGGSPVFTRCTFNGNAAQDGGAVWFGEGGAPTIMECTFAGDEATGHGGEIYAASCDPWLVNTVVAFSAAAEGIYATQGHPFMMCCDVYGNAGGDFGGSAVPMTGLLGNISEDPLFCDLEDGDLTLDEMSPCAPDNNECGVLIGALSVACGAVAVEPTSWGTIKAMFRVQ